MEYLLKASAVVTIFYFCYKLFLQRDTFFASNRGFLLLGLISSFFIPLIVIPVYIERIPISLDHLPFETVSNSQALQTSFSLFDILFYFYLTGIIFFATRFLIQLISLISILLRNSSVKTGKYRYVKSSNSNSPFSFFNWIVYNPELYTKIELQQILSHEEVHARQYHSIDILLNQLACIILWFNPFIWLYIKDIKQNLEFIADYKAQQNASCKRSYQYTLLKTSMSTHQLALTNNFYNSLIKKRIVMLHKSKSKKSNLLKYALVIPILTLFLMSFNTKEIYISKNFNDNKQPILEENSLNKVDIVFDKDVTNSELSQIVKKLKKDSINFTYSDLKRNSKGEIINIRTKFERLNGGHCTYNAINGKVPIEPFKFYKSEKSFGVVRLTKNIQHNETNTFQEKSKKEVEIFLISKHSTDTDIDKLIEKIENNGVTVKIKGIKRNSNGEITSIKIELVSKQSNANYHISSDDAINPIKITIEDKGKNISIGSSSNDKMDFAIKKGKHKIRKSRKNVIVTHDEEVEITDDNTDATEDKVENRVEVIIEEDDSDTQEKKEVNILKYDDDTHDKKVKIKSYNPFEITAKDGKQPLIIIDGEEIENNEIEDVDIDNIESVTVFKYEKAIEKYGEKGKNGVILITSKSAKPSSLIKEMDKALIFIDGKEASQKDMDALNRDNIESIDVSKGEGAIKKFGPKAKNGVIQITTKK